MDKSLKLDGVILSLFRIKPLGIFLDGFFLLLYNIYTKKKGNEMYKFSHFLGYGVIVPEKELKKSPYFQDVLENKFYYSNNIIQLDYNHYDNDEVFIGFKLDVLDEHFQEKSKRAEKDLNQLYQDIMKTDIPAKYEPKMYAKYGYIWEEE